MELIRGDVSSIVRDDVVWYTEATSDAVEELDNCCNCLIGD
jgi:hypothetical protein